MAQSDCLGKRSLLACATLGRPAICTNECGFFPYGEPFTPRAPTAAGRGPRPAGGGGGGGGCICLSGARASQSVSVCASVFACAGSLFTWTTGRGGAKFIQRTRSDQHRYIRLFGCGSLGGRVNLVCPTAWRETFWSLADIQTNISQHHSIR